MRAALAAELRETARIIRHFLPLGRILRASAEFVAIVGMVSAVTVYGIASTTPAPRGALVIAQAAR